MRLLWGILVVIGFVASQNPVFKRFEYKHSFRAPNLAQRDHSIPFWMVTGDAIASQDRLRIAPSMRSRKGIAWNKRPMVESENFEIDVTLKITGQGRVGADGMAIWYTAQMGSLGPVFGANDFWTGMGRLFGYQTTNAHHIGALGLFLDSFDNDGQKNNPMIALMVNDGTRSYDHVTDGSQQILSSCHRDFRNKPYPIHLKIEYLRNVLTVEVNDGMHATPTYEACMRVENIHLPRYGYFGISAATGGLADDHDVLDFSVFSLLTEPRTPTQTGLPQEEKVKYDQEFDRQMKDFEAERAKFKKQHPELKDDDDYDESKFYEDVTVRELRQLSQRQNSILQILQKMEEKLQYIQQGGAIQSAQPGQTGGLLQHEKNEILQSLRDLTQSLRDQKQYVNEIFTKTYNLEQKLGQGIPHVSNSIDSSMHQKVDSLMNEVRTVRANQLQQSGGAASAGCPNISCVSSNLFVILIILHGLIVVSIVFLRSKPDKAKFY
ncbi:Legume-like lectin family protein [Dictyocaulus viviparus]|uniref:Legume-like lectin family protein n=1 Tax=Dictyocaulus viviparus TaxID=29172 RepID=A0A0D8XJS1_DICVI|nr:Legume-like lectin family protein [Dictyocaulus viviparus]